MSQLKGAAEAMLCSFSLLLEVVESTKPALSRAQRVRFEGLVRRSEAVINEEAGTAEASPVAASLVWENASPPKDASPAKDASPVEAAEEHTVIDVDGGEDEATVQQPRQRRANKVSSRGSSGSTSRGSSARSSSAFSGEDHPLLATPAAARVEEAKKKRPSSEATLTKKKAKTVPNTEAKTVPNTESMEPGTVVNGFYISRENETLKIIAAAQKVDEAALLALNVPIHGSALKRRGAKLQERTAIQLPEETTPEPAPAPSESLVGRKVRKKFSGQGPYKYLGEIKRVDGSKCLVEWEALDPDPVEETWEDLAKIKACLVPDEVSIFGVKSKKQ